MTTTAETAVATEAEINRLRRMAGEIGSETYWDADLADAIQKYPLEDARGEGPWIESETTPGTLEVNPDWDPTWDLNAAAADIWAEKAAVCAGDFDFQADGGQYTRSQAYEQMIKMSRYYRSRRSFKTVTMRPEPLMQGKEEESD